jgi:hypothetical protein
MIQIDRQVVRGGRVYVHYVRQWLHITKDKAIQPVGIIKCVGKGHKATLSHSEENQAAMLQARP